MVQLTPQAAAKFQEMLEGEDRVGYGLRLYVTGGGCAGYSYGMAFAEAPEEGDEVVETQGLRVFVDEESAPLVRGAVIDYAEGITGSGFHISNPNARSTCGCGHSFNTDGHAASASNC